MAAPLQAKALIDISSPCRWEGLKRHGESLRDCTPWPMRGH
jgi:hypothetical protein